MEKRTVISLSAISLFKKSCRFFSLYAQASIYKRSDLVAKTCWQLSAVNIHQIWPSLQSNKYFSSLSCLSTLLLFRDGFLSTRCSCFYLRWSSQVLFRLVRKKRAFSGNITFQIHFTKHVDLYCWVTVPASKVGEELCLCKGSMATAWITPSALPLHWLRWMGNDSWVYIVLPTPFFFDNENMSNCQILHPKELRVCS